MNTPEAIAQGRDRFESALAKQGARYAPGARYTRGRDLTAVICLNGHRREVLPKNIANGQGVCQRCSRRDAAAAREEFFATVSTFGARLAPGARYVNSKTPVALICRQGHRCTPRPGSLQRGAGPCTECANNARSTLEAYAAEVREHGARLAAGAQYVNAGTPVELICRNGHACAPTPNNVRRGQGVCEQCRVAFDRVYLAVHAGSAAVKVGVASGARRVSDHQRRGYEIRAQWHGLTHEQALRVERAILAWWRHTGHPVVVAAPEDGRTETAPAELAAATFERLLDELGPASVTAARANPLASAA